MNRACLLVSFLLASCYGRVHHRGRHHNKVGGHHNEFFYDDPPPAKYKNRASKMGAYSGVTEAALRNAGYERGDDLFGGAFRSQKTASEKENPVLIEEAFPQIARSFYGGASLENHGEFGAKLGSFNIDHEDRDMDHDHADYSMEPFDISIPDVSPQHSDMHINNFGDTRPLQDMAATQRGYANHYSASHVGGYPDHGVVISDNVAKKIGLYDKDYLKKLGLDSKDNEPGAKEGPEGSGGEVDLDSLPKEDAKREKERMEKIGVEEYRSGKHADDKKQVDHMKEVFKNSETSGINYNQNGVMVDKKLAEKLGLYDKEYLKKLGVWDEKDKEDEEDTRSKVKSKSKKAKTRSHESEASEFAKSDKGGERERGDTKAPAVKEKEDSAEFSGDSSSGSGAGTDGKESATIDIIRDAKNSANTSAEESKKAESSEKSQHKDSKPADGASKSGAEKKSMKKSKHVTVTGRKRDEVPVPGARPHRHHHKRSKKHKHKQLPGVKRQLMSFMHPSNDYGIGQMRGNNMMTQQQMESQINQNAMNQNAGFNAAENSVSMNGGSPDARSDLRTSDLGNVVNNMNSGRALHLNVGGARTASDGAIHITAASQGVAEAIAQKGSEGGDLSDILSKASAGTGTGDLASFQRGEENVEKGNFNNIEKANFNRGTPNDETIEENSRNFNDVYLDGTPSELSKFEKPGSWKLDKTGEPLKPNAMSGRLDEGAKAYKPDAVSDMVEKLLPMDKGQNAGGGGSVSVEENGGGGVSLGKGDGMVVSANQAENNEIQGDGGSVMKGVSSSDTEMINQILKNGDSAIDTSEGRGELKKLLATTQETQEDKIIEDVPKSASMNSFSGGGMKVDMLGTPTSEKSSQTAAAYSNENAFSRDIGASYEQNKKSAELDDFQVLSNKGGTEVVQKTAWGPMPLAQMIPRRFMQSQMKNSFSAEQQQIKGIGDNSEEEVLQSVFKGARKPQMEGVGLQGMQSFVNSQGRRVGGMNLLPGNPTQTSGSPVETGFSQVGRFNGEAASVEEGTVGELNEHTRRDKLPKHEIEGETAKEHNEHRKRREKLPKHKKEHKRHNIREKSPKHHTVAGDKRQYLAEPEMGERMHMLGNTMNSMNSPRIEAVPLRTPGMQPNMVSRRRKASLGGMQSSSMMSVPKSEYETSFKKHGNMQTNGIDYYMNNPSPNNLCKKHHRNKPGCKRDEMGDSSINGEIQSALDGMNPGHGVNTFNGMSGGVAMMQPAMGMGGMNAFDGTGGMNNPPNSLEGFSQMGGGGMGSSIDNIGTVPGKPMMASYHSDGEAMGDSTGIAAGMGGNVDGNMEHSLIGAGNRLIGGDDRNIDQAMAEEDKISADTTARNAGKLLQKTDEEDLTAGRSGSLLKNTMDESLGHIGSMNFKGHNSSSGNNFEGDEDGEGGESYEEGDDDGDDSKMHIVKGVPGSKVEEGDTRSSDDTDDLNQEIGDQVVKNDGHMMGHTGNVVHGTPCMDCHTAGAIGHGAVISGSEAKKIGLNDEAYLKRLGIKECKIKGPGFSEGNHGGAISDEWAKKLDGFDKKYLQQLGIPEEALEGNTATRDCKFVERIAEVLQAKEEKEAKEPKAEISANAAPEAVKNKEEAKEVAVEKPKPKVKKHSKSVAKVEEKKVTEEPSAETKKDEEKKTPEAEEKSAKADEKEADAKDTSAAEDTSKKSEDIKADAEEKKEDAADGSGNTEETKSETIDVKTTEKSHTNSTGTASPDTSLHKGDAKKEDTDDIYGESEAGLDVLNTRADTLKRLVEEKTITCRDMKLKYGEKVTRENCTARSSNSSAATTADNSTDESSTVSELNNTLAKLKRLEADSDESDNNTTTAKESEIMPMDNDVSKSLGGETAKANDSLKIEKTDFLKRTVTHKRKRLEELRKRLQGLNPSVLRWRSRGKDDSKVYEKLRSEKRYFLKERVQRKRKRLEILRKKLLTLKKNAVYLRSKIISDSKELHKKVQEHLARSSLARHRFKAGQRRLAAKRRRRLHQLRNAGFNDTDNGDD